MLAVIEDTWDPRTLAFMLEIIIVVLDTEANTRLLILGLPVFCKFNFIFFEDHSNMLKIFFFPYVNILLLVKNIFSRIEYWGVPLTPHSHKKSGQKCILNNIILRFWKLCFTFLPYLCCCWTKSKTNSILKLLLFLLKQTKYIHFQ